MRGANGMNEGKGLAWLGTATVAAVILFFAAAAGFLVVQAARMSVALPTRLFILTLAVAGLAFVVSTFMWMRYWREVGWDTSFWTFISGPEPEYPDAKIAWRWGRRARAFWVVVLVSVFAVPIVETWLARQ
jgi:hypothetical protein